MSLSQRMDEYAIRPAISVSGSAAIQLTFIACLASAKADGNMIAVDAVRDLIAHSNAGKALAAPFSSYFADIVLGVFQGAQFPVVMTCDQAPAAYGEQTVAVTFPVGFTYEAEGWKGTLSFADEGDTRLTLEYRDMLTIYESGHIGYTLSLFATEQAPAPRLNEYHLLLLQKLMHPTEGLEGLRRTIAFDGYPLPSFINLRMAALADKPGSALHELLKKKVSLCPVEDFPEFKWSNAVGGGLFVRDGSVFRAFFEGREALRKEASSVQDVAQSAGTGTLRSHLPEGDPAKRRTIALIGLVQGILDFPWQDASEIVDSSESIVGSFEDGVVIHSNSRFLTEFCVESRPYDNLCMKAGTCPYFLLLNNILLYNEVLLVEANRVLHKMEFGEIGRNSLRRESLGGLMGMIDQRFPWRSFPHVGTAVEIIRNNADLFRDLSARKIPNVFRYPTERGVYDIVMQQRGLVELSGSIKVLTERYEALALQAFQVQGTQESSTINRILFLIAVMGLVSLPTDLLGLAEALGLEVPPLMAVASAGALAALAVLLLVAPRRSRKAGENALEAVDS